MVILHELDQAERRMAEHRSSTLRQSLDHRDNRAVGIAVAKLLSGYSSNRVNEADARSTVAAYVAVLADLPPWAVAEACRRWPRGGHGATASAFAPSAEQLHAAAADIAGRFDREATDLTRLLSARVGEPVAPSEAERARVSAGFDKIRADLIMSGLKPMDGDAA